MQYANHNWQYIFIMNAKTPAFMPGMRAESSEDRV